MFNGINKIASSVTIALFGIGGMQSVHASSGYGWWMDGSSWEFAHTDFQPWEYDPCLRDNSIVGTADYNLRMIGINNFVDVYRGSPNISVVDYDSGHDVLPLVVSRIYKTANAFSSSGAPRTQWFSSLDYRLNVGDGEVAAAAPPVTNPDCGDSYYGWGERPLVIAQGVEGALPLFGKVNGSGVIEWYRKGPSVNYSYVKLIKNVDKSWTYYNAENSTIQKYNSAGKILSITDAATNVSLVWTYTSGYTQIRRSSGEWLRLSEDSNGNQIITTSKNEVYKYTTANNHLSVQYPDGESIYYYFDNNGLLLSESVSNVGVTKKYTWNGGLVESETISGEGSNTYSYSGLYSQRNEDIVVEAKNAKGRITKYVIDNSTSDIKTVTGSGGGLPTSTTSMMYSAPGFARTITETNAVGVKKQTTTDNRGWQTLLKEAVGTPDERYVKTEWLTDWHLPKKIETDSTITEYNYYSTSRPLVTLKKIKDKATGEIREWAYQYTFHSNGLISSVLLDASRDDVNDISHEYYDSVGRLIKQVDASGKSIVYSNYDSNGRVGTIKYADGTTKTFIYNSRGWLFKEVISNEVGTATSTFEYDALGNVIKSTDPTGVVTTNVYNAANVVSYNTVGNQRKIFSYDVLGKIVKERVGVVDPYIDPLIGQDSCEERDYEEVNCFTYTVDDSISERSVKNYVNDALGRVTAVTDSRGYSTKFNYDVLSRNVNTVDATAKAVETLTYDKLNRVKTKTDALGRVTTYTYDTDGNITVIKDNVSRLFEYDYNGFGELVNSDVPAVGLQTFNRDSAGNLIEQIQNDGSSISYIYDELNRLEERHISSGSTSSYSYDSTTQAAGSLTGTTDESGGMSFSHNSFSRKPDTVSYSINGKSYSVKYSYDLAGRITSITYPSGYKVTYQRRSTDGSVLKMTDSVGQTLVNSIVYEPFGPMKSFVFPGDTVSYIHDKDYRTSEIKSARFNLKYTFDPVGHIKTKTNVKDVTQNADYSYYANYELNSEKVNSSSSGAYVTSSFLYDPIGNRTRETLYNRSNSSSTLKNFGYDADKKLSSYNSGAVGSDARGNVTSDLIHGSKTVRSFNALNQLTQSVKDGYTTTYKYNALNYRALKNSRFGQTHFIYSENGTLLAEAVNGAIKKEYIYLGNLLVSVRYNNVNYYVYNDISGRPDYVTNSSGTAVWKAHNQAFDRTVKLNSIADLNLGYAGQYYDKETDTWYNLNRDYDAKAGRYLQSDPQGTIDGPNTYVYAGNNPVNRVDPTGEMWFVIVPIALDIGIAMAQNGGDLSKVDYKTILLDAVSLPGPLKGLKWVKAGAKQKKLADNIQKNEVAPKELSANNGNAMDGTKLLTHSFKTRFFKGDEAVQHFERHSSELMQAFGRNSYNLKNYLDDANHVIKNGTFVPEMNGYVRLIGGQGSAKYGFVGLDRAAGNITTFHVKSVSELAKKAPSLGLSK